MKRKADNMVTKLLKGRDFISLADFTKEEIDTIIDTAFQLKLERARGAQHHLLEDKTIFLIFYNRSLRTRNSFECGIMQLGGHANYLDSNMVYTPAAAGAEKAYVTERLDDVSKTLSRFGEAIAIRIYGDPTGWNYGRGNEYVRAFADAADVPVINMECDKYHPCQGLADVMTIKEKLGNLEGRKIVMSWAFSPSRKKPVSVPHSMMAACSLYGAQLVFARPKGFELDPAQIAHYRANVERYGGSFEETDDMRAAFEHADVVYPKSWASLEYVSPQVPVADWDAQDKLFDANRDWICDEEIMKLTNRDCLYMHCLPCDRGFEVTDEVIDGPHSVVFDQAENRLHGQKAVMSLTM
jgi:N-acetylornithine carbamoyltransferase